MWYSMAIVFVLYSFMVMCFYSMFSYKEIVSSGRKLPLVGSGRDVARGAGRGWARHAA